MKAAVRLQQVTKFFGRGKKAYKAVDGLSFEVPQGVVYGFLGANGAGKSTTIRMMTGLTKADHGTVMLYDQPIEQAHAKLRTRVGALVEGAALYPFMTGRQNLEILARTSGCYDPANIQRLLERLGMADRADRRASGYSTGMKQRIGIAAALLNNPDFIVLDEPTNGLDPRGLQDIRMLIRQLVDDEGRTVFLSSHMLHEVEQLCDRVAIIHQGRLVREGPVAELLGEQGRVLLDVEPREAARQALAGQATAELREDGLLVHCPRERVPHLVQQLVAAGVSVYGVQQQRSTLEEYFLSATEAVPSAKGTDDA